MSYEHQIYFYKKENYQIWLTVKYNFDKVN